MTQTMDPFDELAAIFLTEGDDERSPARRAAAHLEIVLVGHLPVRAGLWLPPYADAVARDRGPTALIDLEGDLPRVQLLRHPAEAAGGADWPGLHDAIDLIAADTRCWLIRPPRGSSASHLLALDGAAVTILTATSETAVFHAYKVIRSLAETARRDGRPLPDLGVVLVGSEPHEAEDMGRRLTNAAAAFADVAIEVRRCLPRIDAGAITSGELALADGETADAAQVLEWIRRSKPRDVVAPAAPCPATANGRTPEPAAPPPSEPAAARPAPDAWHPDEDQDELRAVAGVPRRGPAKLTPKTVTLVEPKSSRAPMQPQEHGRPVPLARFVDGLTPLPVRCPRCERIELAVDGVGRLHLLGREPDLREMHVVKTWAREHRDLIHMACRPERIDPQARPSCHVFTDAPVTLADLHQSDLSLHVLAPVRIDDRVAWYSAVLK